MTISKKTILIFIITLFFSGCLEISLEKEIINYPNGAKKREITYKGNYFLMDLIKIIDFYNDASNENPQKISELNYENSVLNGEQEYWYKNGTKNMLLKYRYGLLHGEQLGWHENGKNKFKQNYNFGNLDGLQFSYTKTGNLDRKKLYKNGKLIRIIKD